MFISKKKIGVLLSLVICILLALVALGPSGMATATVQTKGLTTTTLNAPVVDPDGYVTFTLNAPQATEVFLNWQNMVGPSPSADPVAMTKDANGIWSVTLGPLSPNWYGYGFILNGVRIPDPANRNIWSGSTSAWSYVFVPGPEADFMDDAQVPHGAWATVRYFSELTQTERQMQVYTPPGYNHDNRRYPVLYLMHGGGGNDTDWIVNMRANYIMDNLIAQDKIVPMIVVMADGYVGTYPINGPITADLFPQELMDSIIPTIEEYYRVAPGAQNRALAGLSLGGLWTLDTFLLEPGAFAYLGVFSSGWFPGFRTDLVQNFEYLLTNRVINKKTKLLWITVGGPEDIAYNNNYATLELLDEYGINYTFVQGTGGHVWDVWRHNLWDFAPLLFRKTK
jgi:enterochelin esterase-like enzyme